MPCAILSARLQPHGAPAERHAMMQSWADYLDKLKAGAEVIPLKRPA